MSIDRDAIEKIASLSKIKLDEEAIPEVTKRISAILDMVDQMQSVDTSSVEPMANPLDAFQRLRADEVTESNQRDDFQALAPEAEAGLYLVPKVIE
jgi:aspartyl-tRNA(Asn)/glutamyl-tRNA(Gln) amidotransferase subunit C